jgi:CheY-like chemotaxis protein
MELRSVLLVENDTETAERIVQQFTENGVEVFVAINDEDIKKIIVDKIFQIVVLDWHLEEGETSSVLARLCLETIRQRLFVPVIVYTEELESYTAEEDDVRKVFPPVMIKAYDKNDVDYSILLKHIETLHNYPPMQLAEELRKTLISSTEKALYSLAEHSINDLSVGLKTLLKTEDQPEVDVEHVIRILSRLIERQAYRDDDFVEYIKKFINGLALTQPLEGKNISSSIASLYMFYSPSDKDFIVRTGDIVEIDLSPGEIPNLVKAIVLTPACDLATPQKTYYLRLALIEEIPPEEAKKRTESEAEWRYKDGSIHNSINFHKILVLKNMELSTAAEYKPTDTDPKASKPALFIMSYKHNYSTLNNSQIKGLKRIKRFGEPYRSDLLHKFISHAGRIGLPDFSPKSWLA